jgi:hypothetical protein
VLAVFASLPGRAADGIDQQLSAGDDLHAAIDQPAGPAQWWRAGLIAIGENEKGGQRPPFLFDVETLKPG